MPIIRTPMIDDDGSGTTGTIINNAWKQEFYNQIDALTGGQSWSAYTPGWLSASNPQPAGATLLGRYVIVGTIVAVKIHVQMGPATTFGTGSWYFSLPVPAISVIPYVMNVWLLEAGVRYWQGFGFPGGDTLVQVNVPPGANIGPASPWAWKNGDQLAIDGMYEKA